VFKLYYYALFVVFIPLQLHKLYYGSSEPAVFAQRGQSSFSWADIFSFSRTTTDMCLSPVKHSCVAVDTMDEYKVRMNVIGK